MNKPARKKKYERGNQSSFMTETLSKTIMQRSKLRNIFLKKRSEENRNNYTSQRNYTFKETKKEYFGNLNEKKGMRQQSILENSKAFSFGQNCLNKLH